MQSVQTIRDVEPVPLQLHRGDIIFHQGDPASYWYEVISGTVRSCRFLLDGRRQLTGFHFAGDVFGVDQGRCEATADAVCDTLLHRIARTGTEEKPDAKVGGHARLEPDTNNEPHYLHRAYRNAMQFIHLMGHRTAIERISAFLLIIAQRPVAGARLRLGIDASRGDVIDLPMSRADIADHLGLTIHTVSRTISALARQRVIATLGRQQIRIIDRARLAQLASELDFELDEAAEPTATTSNTKPLSPPASSPATPTRAKPSSKPSIASM